MNRLFCAGLLGLSLVMAGCGPKAPDPAIAEAEKQAQLVQERETHFGAVAATPGIDWRPSGLGVQILVPGEGASPRLIDRVRVHYTGKLKDGTVFDSTAAKGKPADFQVAHLLGGFAAAMPSMKVGGKAVFYIPPSLGYGPRKVGDIPANSGLIFEVELLEINPEPAAAKK